MDKVTSLVTLLDSSDLCVHDFTHRHLALRLKELRSYSWRKMGGLESRPMHAFL